MFWHTSRYVLELSRPLLMGIVNVTPDSFSDAGQHHQAVEAMRHCDRLVEEGAHILDIGGESSRPGACSVSADEEWRRIEPALRHAVGLGVAVSVDTCKSEVMSRALDAGADIINDIWALRQPAALDVVARHGRCGVCLMHMQGEPRTMQDAPHYVDVVAEVLDFWREQLKRLGDAGVQASRCVVDPGIGFGKRVEDNVVLLAAQERLLDIRRPLLVGWSRKSTLGALTGRPVHERGSASVSAALLAAQRGARVLRVHDVRATADALALWRAVSPVTQDEGQGADVRRQLDEDSHPLK